MNNLPNHHGAGPPEARGPMQLDRLHWLKAGPDYHHCKLNVTNMRILCTSLMSAILL